MPGRMDEFFQMLPYPGLASRDQPTVGHPLTKSWLRLINLRDWGIV